MLDDKSLLRLTYKIYGLKIKSEILLPELSAISEQECGHIDATISYGKVPKELKSPIFKNKFFQISKSEFYFHIIGVAHYYVTNGNSIVIEPDAECDQEEVKAFLLGSSLGMMLIQRNIVALHGGTVVVDGKGIIITGHCGAGKSTLTSAFIKSGYPFLADDVSALGNNAEGSIIIHPTFPQQKLCKDAMEKMDYDTNKFSIVDIDREKYAIPLDKSFISSPVPLWAIYEINIGTSGNVEISEVLGSDKIKILLKSIYRIEISRQIGFESQYFKYCMNIAKNIPIFKISRPKDVFSVKEQMELIKNTLNIIDEKVI
jgi:hypothetical protein